MASNHLSKLVLVLAAAALSAAAQAPTRVRGTVSAFDGKTLTVDNKTQVLVGEKSEIVFTQPMALAEIKPGDFLAITSVKRPDGTLSAYEVRRFPKPLSPGHRPFVVATTPGRTRSLTSAVARNEPRALATRTSSPVAMPRGAASSGWMTRAATPARRSWRGTLAKIEFRK